jgi:hypothetical protein
MLRENHPTHQGKTARLYGKTPYNEEEVTTIERTTTMVNTDKVLGFHLKLQTHDRDIGQKAYYPPG